MVVLSSSINAVSIKNENEDGVICQSTHCSSGLNLMMVDVSSGKCVSASPTVRVTKGSGKLAGSGMSQLLPS